MGAPASVPTPNVKIFMPNAAALKAAFEASSE